MKVAFISQPFEYITPAVEAGSIAIWTDRVMHALAGRPVQFTVFARRFHGQAAVEQAQGIEYRRVPAEIDDKIGRPFRVLEKLLRFPSRKKPFFASTLNHLGYILQIAYQLRALKPDIVHVHNFSQFVPVIRAFNPQVKIVLHMACEWLSELDYRLIEGRLKSTDLVVTCSDFTTGRVQQRFPQFATRCHTVYNGVDLDRFLSTEQGSRSEPRGAKQLLFVGRVSPEKGVHVLIQAMEQVWERYPDVKVNVVGPAGGAPYEYMVLVSDDPKVNQLARFYSGRLYKDHYFSALQGQAAPFNGKVNFTGAVPHSETIQYYQSADILINPSLTEAFGMSLVEAMASRVPVVASRVGGMTNVVEDGKTGFLVEADRPDALASAILRLLEDDSLSVSMGEAGYQRVIRRYAWDCVADSLWALYQKLERNGLEK